MRDPDPWADLIPLEDLEASGATDVEICDAAAVLASRRLGGILGQIVGLAKPGYKIHVAHPAFIGRGTRTRADRIRTLERQGLRRFRLAVTTVKGETFWWTPQLDESPMVPAPGKVVFTFASLELAIALEVKEWRLVDDDGYLVRLRRNHPAVFPAGHLMNAAYVLAFDGSDKRL